MNGIQLASLRRGDTSTQIHENSYKEQLSDYVKHLIRLLVCASGAINGATTRIPQVSSLTKGLVKLELKEQEKVFDDLLLKDLLIA